MVEKSFGHGHDVVSIMLISWLHLRRRLWQATSLGRDVAQLGARPCCIFLDEVRIMLVPARHRVSDDRVVGLFLVRACRGHGFDISMYVLSWVSNPFGLPRH